LSPSGLCCRAWHFLPAVGLAAAGFSLPANRTFTLARRSRARSTYRLADREVSSSLPPASRCSGGAVGCPGVGFSPPQGRGRLRGISPNVGGRCILVVRSSSSRPQGLNRVCCRCVGGLSGRDSGELAQKPPRDPHSPGFHPISRAVHALACDSGAFGGNPDATHPEQSCECQ